MRSTSSKTRLLNRSARALSRRLLAIPRTALAAAAVLAFHPADAADISWLGGSGNWSSASSWLGGVLPSFEDIVRIEGGGQMDSSVYVDLPAEVRELYVGSGVLLNVGSLQWLVANSGIWNAGRIIVSSGLTVSGGMQNSAGSVVVTDSGSLYLSGNAVSGNAIWSGGNIDLYEGALFRMDDGSSIYGATVTGYGWGSVIYSGRINSSVLDGLLRIDSVALENVNVRGRSMIQSAAMSGINSVSGSIYVGNNGSLHLLPNARLVGGSIEMADASLLRMYEGSSIYGATITGNGWGNPSVVYSGRISSSDLDGFLRIDSVQLDNVNVRGRAVVQSAEMSGINSISGSIYVANNGALSLNPNAVLGGGNIDLADASLLRMYEGSFIFGATITGNGWVNPAVIYGGRVSSSALDGFLRIDSVQLDNVNVLGRAVVQSAAMSGINSISGSMYVPNNGTLSLHPNAVLGGGSIDLADASLLRMEEGSSIYGATVTGNGWSNPSVIYGGRVDFGSLSGNLRISGVVLESVSINQDASIQVASSDAVTMSGVTVNRGTLLLAGGSSVHASGEFNNTSGVVDIGNGAYLEMAAGGSFYGGTVRGTGTAALRGAGSFSNVALDGTVAIQGGNFSNVSLASTMQSLTVVENGTLNLAGQDLAQTAEATMVVNGSLTVDTLTVEAGTLKGSGTIHGDVVNTGGVIAPGNSPGMLTIDGDLTLGPDSLIMVEAVGTAQGSQYDWVLVTGDAHLDGDVQLDIGYSAATGDSFSFLTTQTGTVTGQFDHVFATGYALKVTYSQHGVDVQITGVSAVPEPESWALMLSGIGVVLWLGMRGRRTRT